VVLAGLGRVTGPQPAAARRAPGDAYLPGSANHGTSPQGVLVSHTNMRLGASFNSLFPLPTCYTRRRYVDQVSERDSFLPLCNAAVVYVPSRLHAGPVGYGTFGPPPAARLGSVAGDS
jgi:hypothetical protein